ncbi:hypothetical protein BGZ46_004502 [Entomortierella lignicola]|nr:hypothetical protein BGZ46_004502 [Entomortierella lignicola]
MAKTDIPTPSGTGHLDSMTPEQKEILKQMWAEYFQIVDSGEACYSVSSSSVSVFERSGKSKVITGKKSWFGGSKSSKVANSSTSRLDLLDDNSSRYLSLSEIGLHADQVRPTFWGCALGDHPDALFLRFLRARKWNMINSMTMFLKAFKWRIENDVDELLIKNEDELDLKYSGFKRMIEIGKSYTHGTDKQGRIVVYVNVRLHKPSELGSETAEKLTIYHMEMGRTMIQYPVETACLVFDMTGFGLSNMDYNLVKHMITCFEAYYPESLGVLLIHKAPIVFWGVWKIIEPLLDPVVVSKIRFTRSDADLMEYIDASHLPDKFDGGLDTYSYKYFPVVPGENDRMKDTATKERLTQEWKAIMWKFEAVTREWIACEKTEGARPMSVIEAERSQIVKEIRVAFFKLEPYIRARTIYHRTERPVMQADGSVTKSLVAIGASVGLLASTSGAIAFAEGQERKQKLPIYDEPEPEMVVKEEPTRLDEALRIVRKETDRQILGMKYHLQAVTNKVVDIEKEAETTVKSVLVKEEEVMPAALYVIVAGFAGSIVARRHNILLRFLSPVAFSAMAFGYFFPASSNRLIARANQSDFSKYLPQEVQNQFRDLTNQVGGTIAGTAAVAENKVTKAVEEVKSSAKEAGVVKNDTIQSKVQDKAQEAASSAKDTANEVTSKVAEVKKAIVGEIEKEKAKVGKAVEELDREARLAKIKAEDLLKRV